MGFEVWWSFSMKYFFSFAVWFLTMRFFRNDLPIEEGETFYGNYHIFWQIMGFLYPLAGLIMFVGGAAFCTDREEDVGLDKIEDCMKDETRKGEEEVKKSQVNNAPDEAKEEEKPVDNDNRPISLNPDDAQE